MTRFIPGEKIETTLGVPLIWEEDSQYSIDLTNMRIFWGLSILSRTLGDEITERALNDPGDLCFIHKINPNINAELVEMHIGYIQIYARAGVLKDILLIRDEFQDHLRAVFGTIQRQVWAKQIHPEFYGESPLNSTSKALVFPFHHASPNEKVDYQFILERVPNQKEPGEFLFRLTIENYDRANINLESIPHVIVDDLESRTYIAGSTKISESIHKSVISACEKGEKKYTEENSRFSKIFEQLEKTALGSLYEINFLWKDEFSSFILSKQPRETLPIFKKLFLILEDHEVTRLLKNGYRIRAILGKINVFIDLSRLDRVLNYSFIEKRHSLDLSYFLARMPELESIAKQKNHKNRLDGIHIFLIHHITSEVLALMEAFRLLGVESLYVAFVKYGGKIPPVYLDVLLDLPMDNYFLCGLELKISKDHKVYYSISPLYSDLFMLQDLKNYLEEQKLGFFEAMKLLATNVFLRKALDAWFHGYKILLVEDGGYIAPFLNQYALENYSLKEVLKIYQINPNQISLIANKNGKQNDPLIFSEELSLSEFLSKVLIGSIEHTRNGYDRLKKVQEQKRKLFLPAYTIAISHQKVQEESREVAHSILKAIEDILHGLGKILSRRKILVLGSAGNIGSYLCKYLRQGRMHENNHHLIEVDLKNQVSEWTFTHIDQIPLEKILNTDLIIGVIGESILQDSFWENLILNSNHKNIYIASGSTKTVEFSHLISWLDDFITGRKDNLQGYHIKVNTERIIDPQSGMDQGGLVQIEGFKNGKVWTRNLYLLSDLSPVNFLYYGVPTEMMDSIISELLKVSLGMVDQYKKQSLPEPKLYAVDWEIDSWGNPISASPSTKFV